MTNNQLKVLKEAIDNNLIIRNINVETTLEFDEEKQRFNLDSTKFQTVPVIHFNLHITNFGGGVSVNEENDTIQNIYIPVHISYDGNGVGLFTLTAQMVSDHSEEVFNIKINHFTN